MNLINLYFLANWLPTLVSAAGYSASTAVLAGTTLQVGGVMGTLLMGRVIDRVGFGRVLVPVFLLAAVAVAGFCVVVGSRRSMLWRPAIIRCRCGRLGWAGAWGLGGSGSFWGQWSADC